jgi:phytol kinase
LEISPFLPLSTSFIALYLGLLLLIAERLKSWLPKDGEITRKVVHIGTGNVILLAWWLQIPTWVGIAASVIASIIAIISYFLPILPSINSVGRRSWGTLFYAISIGVLVAWFWPLDQPWYAAIGILTMALGDGLAALVGQNFGQHPYQILGNSKSIEGSLTMAGMSFLVAAIVLFGVYGVHGSIALVALGVAIGATLLESFSTLGIDNLSVPIGSAAIAYYLCQVL